MTLQRKAILVAMLLVAGRAGAAPVTPDRAARVAHNFWKEVAGDKSETTLRDCTAEWPFDGIYLFAGRDGGFVLVAADDAVKPVLGYSLSSTIDPRRLPLPLQEWLAGYQQQVEWVRTYDGKAYDDDAAEWRRLTAGAPAKDGDGTGVGPLLTTRWDQTEPYNELCPAGTVTGCAATAQAQMMKYWNHPAFGNGQHAYTAQGYGSQRADFGHTRYDWQHMPDEPTQLSPTAERMAVATLMYHCGVSLDMAYNTASGGGSAAAGLAGIPGVRSIDNSLKDFFFYSPQMRVVTKDYGYTNATWRSALMAELDLGHPIVYTGSATQGGHGFVCDGYDSRQYMHFNFGWSGEGDGYYPVDSISPGVGGVGGNVTYTFNMTNQALLGAVPVYDLRVSDTLFSFAADGGRDSLLFCADPTVDAPVAIGCSEPWATVDTGDGWVRIAVPPFEGSGERTAALTFAQGAKTRTVRIVQLNYREEDMCPLTVVMESTNGSVWQGDAHLTLESASGYVFGTAKLTSGRRDSVSIAVAPHDVYSVWHSGGGTDRYINYYVKNQYGEVLVEAVYAFRTGGTDLIAWPCSHVEIEQVGGMRSEVGVYPNPAVDYVEVSTAEPLRRVVVRDVTGRVVYDGASTRIAVGSWPAGTYILQALTDTGTALQRIVKQ